MSISSFSSSLGSLSELGAEAFSRSTNRSRRFGRSDCDFVNRRIVARAGFRRSPEIVRSLIASALGEGTTGLLGNRRSHKSACFGVIVPDAFTAVSGLPMRADGGVDGACWADLKLGVCEGDLVDGSVVSVSVATISAKREGAETPLVCKDRDL